MAPQGLKQRHPPDSTAQRTSNSKDSIDSANATDTPEAPDATSHPGGTIKHGTVSQGIRMVLFALYFNGSIVA